MPQPTRVNQSAIAAVKSNFEAFDFTSCVEFELPAELKETSTVRKGFAERVANACGKAERVRRKAASIHPQVIAITALTQRRFCQSTFDASTCGRNKR